MNERGRERAESGEEREIVRAHGFELIDDAGRTRAVLDSSRLWADAPEAPRLRFYDREGDERAWIGFHHAGVALGFVQGGNEVFQVGVYDPDREAGEPGCYLLLGNAEGVPVLQWFVSSDGEAVIEQPSSVRSGETEVP